MINKKGNVSETVSVKNTTASETGSFLLNRDRHMSYLHGKEEWGKAKKFAAEFTPEKVAKLNAESLERLKEYWKQYYSDQMTFEEYKYKLGDEC